MKILKIMLEDVVNNIINLHIALYRSLKGEALPALICTTLLAIMLGLGVLLFYQEIFILCIPLGILFIVALYVLLQIIGYAIYNFSKNTINSLKDWYDSAKARSK